MPPDPALSVLVHTFDTLGDRLRAGPKRPSSPRDEKNLLSVAIETCQTNDRHAIKVLALATGDLQFTLMGYRSLKHRIEWFRALAHLFLQFIGDVKFRPLCKSFLDGLKKTVLWPEEEVVDYIKYFTVAQHWRFFKNFAPSLDVRNDPPKRPSSLPISVGYRLFGGTLGRFLCQRVIETHKKWSRKFFYSFFQTKRGCAAMDEHDIEQTYNKHRKAMDQEPLEIDEDLKPRIRQVVRNLIGQRAISLPVLVEHEFSHNSCFTGSRKKGGTQKATLVALHEMLSRPPTAAALFGQSFQARSAYVVPPMDMWIERELRKVFLMKNLPIDLIPKICAFIGESFFAAETRVASMEYGQPGSYREKTILSPLPFSALVWGATMRPNNRVQVEGILEPLKVRTITKGDCLTYSASMPMQKMMHGRLKSREIFSLIGKPLSVDNLNWLSNHPTTTFIEDRADLCSEEAFWVSGDYSGATDSLAIGATKTIFEEICRIQSQNFVPDENISKDEFSEFLDICRHVLYEQEVHYPEGYHIPPVLQRNGQLMGSTLSFPVLCIANLLTYWLALEDYMKEIYGENQRNWPFKVRLRTLATLVNGDDILFRANSRLYQLWKIRVAEFGFTLSPGKSLIHPSIATINSQQWYFTSARKWVFEPYFNVGLMIRGQSGKISKTSDTQAKDLQSVWSEVKEGSWNKELSWDCFSRLHTKKMCELSRDGMFNYFVDPCLGGLGFEKPSHNWKFRFTRFQRGLAKARLEEGITKKPKGIRYESRGGCKNYSPFLEPKTYLLEPADECRLPDGWTYFVEDLPSIPNTDLQYFNKEIYEQEFELVQPSVRSVFRFWKANSGKTFNVATKTEMRRRYQYLPVIPLL